MTVAAGLSRKFKFVGSGTTGPFVFSERVIAKTGIKVTKIDDASGDRTILTEGGGDFSATLVDLGLSGVSITTTDAVAVGETLLIEGNTSQAQAVDYANQGEFFPETHENSFDRLHLITQELAAKQQRSLQVGAETTLTDDILVDEPVAGAYLLWNSAGTGITNSTVLARIAENEQTDDYTLALSDENKLVSLSGSTAKTFTIPANATVAFPVGSQIFFMQKGTGALDIAAAGGVTILSEFDFLTLNTTNSFASAIKIATNTWILAGSLRP